MGLPVLPVPQRVSITHAFEGAFCRDPRSEGRSTGYNCPKVSPMQVRFCTVRLESA